MERDVNHIGGNVTLKPSDYAMAVDDTKKRVVRARGCNAIPEPFGVKILYVDVNLHQKLKLRAITEGLTLQALTAQVMSAYVMVPFDIAEPTVVIDQRDILTSVEDEVE